MDRSCVELENLLLLVRARSFINGKEGSRKDCFKITYNLVDIFNTSLPRSPITMCTLILIMRHGNDKVRAAVHNSNVRGPSRRRSRIAYYVAIRALAAIARTHISYGAALAEFVASSYCVALHMVKLPLYLESMADVATIDLEFLGYTA